MLEGDEGAEMVGEEVSMASSLGINVFVISMVGLMGL